ncbi:MAG: M13 family metallopeptidase [Bacteroidetes bacterium]|nr:M13 family metallopeptidase [Bacteroidota bacterium]MCB0842909.1 M13 family metallopeptidase [Bacteroidota bacterium]
MFRKFPFSIAFFILLALACQEDKPERHGADLSHRDLSVEPAEDFFHHANGKWIEETEIPASRSAWGSFYELIEDNNTHLKNILEGISGEEHPTGSIEQLIGDFYYSGMDSAGREAAGFEPIKDKLALIDNLQEASQISEILPQLHLYGISGFFRGGVRPDMKNSTINAYTLYQGGLGLPERDYYFNESPRFVAYRKAYHDFIGKGFQLIGSSEEEAVNAADLILNMETRIASVSRTRLALRDNEKNYNKYATSDAEQLISSFSLKGYMDNLGLAAQEYVIVGQPEFFEGLDKILQDFSASDIQTYLKWRVISGNASRLTAEFEQASFDFNQKTLNGVPEMQPRWKRVSQATDNLLGEALGKLYVEKHFTPEAKTRVNELVNNLRVVLEKRIGNLEWMGAETKEQALHKLHKITQKLGYPDTWRDYSELEISRDNYALNIMNAIHFEIRYDLAKAGKEVDRGEWGISPPTVNAYYNPSNNEIVFPAGILQPPFFYPNAIDPVNYGGIGTVIGHEITHGFDDRGSGFDADGNLKNWWTEEDRERFEGLTKKIVEQYNEYVVLDSIHVNGELTLGENIADLGGIAISFEAMKLAIEENGTPETFDGLTPEQQFFYSYANLWRGKYRDDALLQRIKVDTHSPGIFRVNGVLSNFKPFYEAFGVEEGDGMSRPEIVEIW